MDSFLRTRGSLSKTSLVTQVSTFFPLECVSEDLLHSFIRQHVKCLLQYELVVGSGGSQRYSTLGVVKCGLTLHHSAAGRSDKIHFYNINGPFKKIRSEERRKQNFILYRKTFCKLENTWNNIIFKKTHKKVNILKGLPIWGRKGMVMRYGGKRKETTGIIF